jgi:hypothetical protein
MNRNKKGLHARLAKRLESRHEFCPMAILSSWNESRGRPNSALKARDAGPVENHLPFGGVQTFPRIAEGGV